MPKFQALAVRAYFRCETRPVFISVSWDEGILSPFVYASRNKEIRNPSSREGNGAMNMALTSEPFLLSYESNHRSSRLGSFSEKMRDFRDNPPCACAKKAIVNVFTLKAGSNGLSLSLFHLRNILESSLELVHELKSASWKRKLLLKQQFSNISRAFSTRIFLPQITEV